MVRMRGEANDGARGGALSAGEKSAGDKSAGEKSAGEKSAGEKSAGEKSAGEKSAGDKSAKATMARVGGVLMGANRRPMRPSACGSVAHAIGEAIELVEREELDHDLAGACLATQLDCDSRPEMVPKFTLEVGDVRRHAPRLREAIASGAGERRRRGRGGSLHLQLQLTDRPPLPCRSLGQPCTRRGIVQAEQDLCVSERKRTLPNEAGSCGIKVRQSKKVGDSGPIHSKFLCQCRLRHAEAGPQAIHPFGSLHGVQFFTLNVFD